MLDEIIKEFLCIEQRGCQRLKAKKIKDNHLLVFQDGVEYSKKTRMKNSKKTKFKKLDDQTNIDKYRVTSNITECHNITTAKGIIPESLSSIGQFSPA